MPMETGFTALTRAWLGADAGSFKVGDTLRPGLFCETGTNCGDRTGATLWAIRGRERHVQAKNKREKNRSLKCCITLVLMVEM